MNKISVFFLWSLLFALAPQVHAEKLTHGYLAFPPFFNNQAMKDATGHWGLGRVLMDRIYSNAGMEVKWIELPYARVVEELKKGRYTFQNLGSGEFDDYVYYPMPGGQLTLSVVHRKGMEVVPKTVEEFEAMMAKLAVVRAWPIPGFEKLLNSDKVKLNLVNKPIQGIRMLELNRADYMIILRSPIDLLPEKNKTKIEMTPLYSMEAFYTSVSKKYPGAKEIADRIKKSFDELKASGEIIEVEGGRHVLKEMLANRLSTHQ